MAELSRQLLKKIHEVYAQGVLRKLFLFLVAGIPGILLAIPVNYLLVSRLHMPPFLAYGLVLLLQVSINYVFCRIFVFDVKADDNVIRQYATFLSGILVFRLFDWALYCLIIATTGIYFLYVQIFNVLVFSLLKFSFAKKVMEKE